MSFFAIISCVYGFSQDFDTVRVNEGEDLIINNKLHRIQKDTVFYIPSSIPYQVKRYKIGDEKQLYDSIEIKAANGNWLSNTIKDLLLKPKPGKEGQLLNPDDLSDYFVHNNKIINEIKIIRLDPFGTSVNNQKNDVENWFEKAGNTIHLKTTENVVRKHLLFEENQEINPYNLNDSERLLRNLSNIKDAKILIEPMIAITDSVNVIVITRDVWSKAFGLSTKNFESGQFDFWDRNIFGLGHENKNGLFWDADENPALGYKGQYNLNNISGTFINWKSTYWDLFGSKVYRTEVFRDFYTPDIRYAGGVLLDKSKLERDIWTRDSIYIDQNYSYYGADAWLAHSVPILRFDRFQHSRSNILLAARFQYENYTNRPEGVNADLFYQFHDKTRIFLTLGLNSQKFKRSNLIYSFGRTEDIPYGYLLTFTGGYEFGEFYRRSYLNLSFSHAIDMPQDNYLRGSLDIGGFFRGSHMEQGIFRIESNYFTQLFRLRGFRFRYFANASFSNGINLFNDQFTTISNGEGIDGLRSHNLVGARKLVFNTELVSFTPIYIFGFRMVIYGFGDFGVVGNYKLPLLKENLYSGYGLGIRLRNERLTFNTIQIRLAIYPRIPHDANPELIQFSGEPRLRPNDFFLNKPAVPEL